MLTLQLSRNFILSRALFIAIVCASFVSFTQERIQAQSNDPELPRVLLDTTYPATSGRRIDVRVGDNLQQKINDALPGDTLWLEAGATFAPPSQSEPFYLPAKDNPNNQWIIIRSASTAFDANGSLPSGTRVDGNNSAHTSQMAKIRATIQNSPAIVLKASAHHYRLVGIDVGPLNAGEIAGLSEVTRVYNMIIPEDWSDASEATMPSDIVIDRCYIHGEEDASNPYRRNFRRGIALNGKRMSVIDSHISNFHDFEQANGDSQAILGWTGPGPFKIVNNYLEAASENIMFGGGRPPIIGLVPSDIEIQRNTFSKPERWRTNGLPQIKNLFELKSARRVLINGNLFERTWRQAQDVALVLKSAGVDGATWCVTEHVTITNNIIRDAPRGILLNGFEGGAVTRVNHVKVENNLFDRIDGTFMQIASADSVTINHNTVFNAGDIINPVYGDPSVNFVFSNTIVKHGYYGVKGDGTGTGTDQGRSSTFDRYFLGYTFTKNALVGAGPPPYGPFYDPSTWYPAGNLYPITYDSVGFVDLANGNYRLAPTSPYKNAGTDGKDIGADIDAINAAINPSPSPFTGTPSAVPGIIEAENFDNGGEGIAYHDVDVGNNGGEYRSTDVDVRSKVTASNGYDVFNAYPGEWLKYTVNVQTTGMYNVGATAASRLEGGTFHIEVDGTDVTGALKAPTTGSWSTFQYVGKTGVSLTAGTHVLRLSLDTAGVEGIIADFDTISVTASTSTPFTGTPATVPGAIEAENFDNGGEGIAYHDIDAGNNGAAYRSTDVDVRAVNAASNGYDVFNAYPGEWLKYTINVSNAGTYSVGASVASRLEGGTFHIEVDGTDVTGSLKAPTTGSWYVFQPVSKSGVNLSAGTHVLRLVLDTGGVEGIIADFDTININ